MRILHIASFEGNIGDCVSHEGLQVILSDCFETFTIDKVEIRNFYQNASLNKQYFDAGFIETCNSYDLTIIGGGGYLECNHDASQTGTTFDIDISLLDKLIKPLIFSSIGCFPVHFISEANRAKFDAFLAAIMRNPLTTIMLRNDGSYEYVTASDQPHFDSFAVTLDNGYFCQPPEKQTLPKPHRPYIAINFGYDQIAKQIAASQTYDDWDGFCADLGDQIQKLSRAHPEFSYLLVPHTPQDIYGFAILMKHLPDDFLRYHLRVSELALSAERLAYVKEIYANASLSVCGRLHSHVLGVLCSKRVLSLAPIGRVANLISSPDLGLPEISLAQIDQFSEVVERQLGLENSCHSKLYSAREETLQSYKDVFRKQGLM